MQLILSDGSNKPWFPICGWIPISKKANQQVFPMIGMFVIHFLLYAVNQLYNAGFNKTFKIVNNFEMPIQLSVIELGR